MLINQLEHNMFINRIEHGYFTCNHSYQLCCHKDFYTHYVRFFCAQTKKEDSHVAIPPCLGFGLFSRESSMEAQDERCCVSIEPDRPGLHYTVYALQRGFQRSCSTYVAMQRLLSLLNTYDWSDWKWCCMHLLAVWGLSWDVWAVFAFHTLHNL